MDEAAPALNDPPPLGVALDASIALCERRLRAVGEMIEHGLALSRSLVAAAAATPGDAAAVSGAAQAFARLTRALRLTLALETRVDEELRQMRTGVPAAREADAVACNQRAWDPTEERHELLTERVGDVARMTCETEDDYGEVLSALRERLGDDEAYHDVTTLQVRALVERLCKDLTLTPDWSLWDDAREDWREGAVPLRPRSCAFNIPSAARRWPDSIHPTGMKPNPPRRLKTPRAAKAHPLE